MWKTGDLVALVRGPGPGHLIGFDTDAGAAVDRCDQSPAQRLGQGGSVKYGWFPQGFQTILQGEKKINKGGASRQKGSGEGIDYRDILVHALFEIEGAL